MNGYFGETCVATEECTSALCIAVAAGRAVCTRACSERTDCPGGPSWGCVAPAEIDASVCACAATGDREICGDGIDNDCDGATDDCRICDGAPVPEDSHDHCGACGRACRDDQECRDGACRCALPGLTECGDRCVALGTDPEHCGGCGVECAPTQECVSGACGCIPPTSDECGGRCVDTTSDSSNCGACMVACGVGRSCVGGACECLPGGPPDFCESSGCVDLLTDERQCGDCDVACRAGETCRDGACACPTPGELWCGGGCVDVSSRTDHCGACERACAPGERCSAGVCTCDSGLLCGGACAAVDDPSHCGACGVTCRIDQRCAAGRCACIGSARECGGACVETASDPSHCGACGVVCRAGEVCAGGVCRCPLTGWIWCASTGTCVDGRSDEAHCGSCDRACAGPETCDLGACRCPTAGQTYCSATDTCSSLSTDPANCGSCGRACAPVEVCRSGVCDCPVGSHTYCASIDACVDTASDDGNCGGCGVACPAETFCSSATCRCSTFGLTLCGDSCVDVQTDEAHCGSCGAACVGGRECVARSCRCPAPSVDAEVRVTTTDAGEEDQVRTASTGTHVGAVWRERTAGAPTPWTIRFALLDSTGVVVGSERVLAGSTGPMGSPDIVWTGAEFGVAWVGDEVRPDSVSLQRLDGTGIPIGGRIDPLAALPTARVQYVRISWAAGSGYGLALRRIDGPTSTPDYFQAVGTDGSSPALPIALPRPVISDTSQRETDIAGAPDGRFGIVFQRCHFLVVQADGSITTSPASFDVEFLVHDPRIEHDGLRWIIVATNLVASATPRRRVLLFRSTALASPLVVFDGADGSYNRDPAVAFAGNVASLVFVHGTGPTSASDLWHARIHLPPVGTPSVITAAAPLTTGAGAADVDFTRPEIAHLGPTRILATWSDRRATQHDIYALGADVATCF